MNPDLVGRRLALCCLALACLGVLGLTSSQVHDFDLFWQLQSGRFMWESGAIIRQDLFSLAAEMPRWEHCWLHDLIFFAVYQAGGYAGLSLFKGVLLTSTAVLLMAAARLRGGSPPVLLLAALPVFFLTRGGWLERPQLWSYLLFAAMLLCLEASRRTDSRKVFWLVPLMVCWANLHAGAILAYPVFAAYVVGFALDSRLGGEPFPPGHFRRLGIVAPLLVLCGFLTPYGGELFRALWSAPSLGVDSGMNTQLYNMDWRPTDLARNPQLPYLWGAAALLAALSWRRGSWADLCLFAGLTLMALKLERHVPFLYMGFMVLAPRYVELLGARLKKLFPRLESRLAVPAVLLLGLLAVLWMATPVYRTYGLFRPGLRTWQFPVAAAEFVRQESLPANLYNTYDWGGYLMWVLYPEYRVFWDGRQSSPAMFDAGHRIMRGADDWPALLASFDVNTVLTKTCTVDTGQHYPLIDRLRDSPEWALVHADQSALVYVRIARVPADWLERHRLPPERADDAILSEATLLVADHPGRYMAWWEIARIRVARREYAAAFQALERHLAHAPQGQHLPAAEQLYRTLYPMRGRFAGEIEK